MILISILGLTLFTLPFPLYSILYCLWFIWIEELLGIIDRSLVYYLGLSGIILRASYSYYDIRILNYESYAMLDYHIFIAYNSDCLDRFIIRINEIMNSSLMVYICLYYIYISYYLYYNHSIMQSIISFYLSYSLFSGAGCILSYSFISIYSIESSKGIYCIFIANYLYWSLNIISNDYMMISQLNSYGRVYNIGDLIAMLGSMDFVLGSVDLYLFLILYSLFIILSLNYLLGQRIILEYRLSIIGTFHLIIKFSVYSHLLNIGLKLGDKV